MENNETMMNEEVIERTEETANGKSVDGRKVAIGVGLTALVGAIVYKKVIKPRIDKAIDKAVERYHQSYPVCEAEFEECCEEEVSEEN